MKALYFGSAERQLFGVYHPVSDDQTTRRSGVVLCSPWLSEQNLSHRALRNLARSLSSEGFPTIRFDYYGTGDSAGDTGAAGPRDNAADVGTAAQELRELAGVAQVTAVGRGIGALAALLAAEAVPLQALVLWDPVLEGRAQLRRLLRLDWRQRLVRMQLSRRDDPETLLGYPFPKHVRSELAETDARRLRPQVARCLLLVAKLRGEHASFAEHLRGLGIPTDVEQIDDASQTGDVRAADTALLVSKPLVRIVSWLKEQA